MLNQYENNKSWCLRVIVYNTNQKSETNDSILDVAIDGRIENEFYFYRKDLSTKQKRSEPRVSHTDKTHSLYVLVKGSELKNSFRSVR